MQNADTLPSTGGRESISDPKQHPLPAEIVRSLQLYLIAFMFLTALAWIVVGIRGNVLHQSFPPNSLVGPADLRFSDFTEESNRVAHYGERDMLVRTDLGVPYPYPVPSIYAFLFFLRVSHHPVAAYITFVIVVFVFSACLLSGLIRRETSARLPHLAIWCTLCAGFPLIYLIDRGNIEAVLWLIVLLGVLAYTKDRMYLSAILWSMAAAMKLFTGIFLVMFLAKRRFGAFLLAICLTIAISLLALADIGPSIHQALADSASSTVFLRKYLLGRMATGFDVSLFVAIKQCIYAFCRLSNGTEGLSAFALALRVYNLVVLFGMALLYWYRLRHLPVLNQFMAYLILAVLLPQISFEYKLIYIYLAWGAFLLFLATDVANGKTRIPVKTMHVIMLSCAVVFSPLAYLRVGVQVVGGQVKMLFLLLMLTEVLRIPMPSSLFGDVQGSGA